MDNRANAETSKEENTAVIAAAKIIAEAIKELSSAIRDHTKVINMEAEPEDPVQFDLSGKPF